MTRTFLRSQCSAALLCGALFLGAGCGGDQDSGQEAGRLLDRAATREIASAELVGQLRADLEGLALLGGPLVLDARGPARWNGPRALPEADLELSFRGGGQSFPARVSSTPSRAFVELQGLEYEVERDLLGRGGTGSDPTGEQATSLDALGLDPAGWFEDPTVRDGKPIGGRPTRSISGTVDVAALLEDLADAAGSLPVARELLGAASEAGVEEAELSDAQLERLERNVEAVTASVDVDDQGFPRRAHIEVRVRAPEGGARGVGPGTVRADLELRRLAATVNVRPPANPRGFDQLLRGLGGLLGIDSVDDLIG